MASALISSKFPTTSITLPHELWFEILQEATFSPREFDVSATAFRSGLRSGSDMHQYREYRKILSTRVAIVNVCRIWHNIGTKFLYGSVHFLSPSNEATNPWGRLNRLRMLLESRPDIGTLVKRLSLPYDPANQDAIDILRLCPRITIFSSSPTLSHDSWWAPALLHPVLRQLDIMIYGRQWSNVVSALNCLIYLEVLYIRVEWLCPAYPINCPSLSLPALRLLALSVHSDFGSIFNQIVTTFDVPRLQALSFFPRAASHTHAPPLPPQLQGVTSLKASHVHCFRADDLQNLNQVFLTVHPSTLLPSLSSFIPFHRIERLGLNLPKSPWDWVDRMYNCERLLSFPLDVSAMPKLRILELCWSARRVVDWNSTAVDRSEFVEFFQGIITSFEQRGVHMSELDLLHDPMSFQSIVNSFSGKGRRQLCR